MSERDGSGDDPASGDVAMIVDRAADHDGYQVLRRRSADADIELGTLKPLREGRPIDGEVISLRPREGMPFVFNVKTELEVPPSAQRRLTSDGPAQVATEGYRLGWEAIWGADSGQKPN